MIPLTLLCAVASVIFFIAAAAGLVLVVGQVVYLRRFIGRAPIRPTQPMPGLSILKPLCGLDDGLEENLLSFARLDAPTSEVLLGFRSADDPAFSLARQMVERYTDRFRIVMQRGEPGLNPKVNQLITLAKEARYDILVVSDASVRVGPDFLPEIAAHFERPEVALVTHPVAGSGEQMLGAFCDNLRITVHVSAGPIGVKELTNQDIVLGKSMAFRRSSLEELGGFESVKDYLAEDFVFGRRIGATPGMKVVFARDIPLTVCNRRTVGAYVRRYGRWAILQRYAAGPVIFTLQNLMNPSLLALIGFLLFPSWRGLGVLSVIAVIKSAIDVHQMRLMRPEGFPLSGFFLVPVNDVLQGVAWFYGLTHDQVEWRGNLLQVTTGTRLVPISRSSKGGGGPRMRPLTASLFSSR